MKNLLLFFILASFSIVSYSQTIQPAETTEICPHPDYLNATLTSSLVVRFEIDFGSINASDYTIITDPNNSIRPHNCKVISNLQPISTGSHTGQCYIAFEDQRGATPVFSVQRISTGTAKSFQFPLIRSLKDLPITTPVTLPVWDFPLCTSGSVPYTTNVFKYKRTDDQQDFGFAIPFWEYLVPQGWTVSGQTSDGSTPILAGVNATIMFDKTHAGTHEIKIRGSQAGYLCDNLSGIKPVPGKWLIIPFTRPIMKLTSGGSSAVSVKCGYEITKTFVLENANLGSCITHYVWNLGSSTNGWQYGGTAAPASITINGATNNSLTLTSYCNQAPSPLVAVTAYAGTEALGTFTIPVSYDQTPPIPNITGPTTDLCTSDPVIYTLAGNLPCDAVVNWSVSPAGILSIVPNGSSITVSPLADGHAQLQATITSCGQTSLPTAIGIDVGRIATVQSLTINNVDPATSLVCHYQESMIQAFPGIIEQDVWYEWNLPGSWSTLENGTPNAITQDYMLPVYPGSDGTVDVRRFNQCGHSDFYSVFVSFDPWCGDYYIISPNPATNNITVDGQKQKKNIKEVRIVDKTGQVRRMSKFGDKVQRVNLNISGLPPDIYYLRIFDGKEWRSKPIRVK